MLPRGGQVVLEALYPSRTGFNSQPLHLHYRRLAARSNVSRMNSETVLPLAAAARSISAHASSSMRKYRLGVTPVAGLPRSRFGCLSMPAII